MHRARDRAEAWMDWAQVGYFDMPQSSEHACGAVWCRWQVCAECSARRVAGVRHARPRHVYVSTLLAISACGQ